MVKKILDFLKGEIVSSVFYIAFGLCLLIVPDQTVNIICKVIFGLLMIVVGIYHIVIYAAEKWKATILDLFTGVIVLVLGVFLFFTPQIVIKIFPYLLGSFVLVDSIWKLKGCKRLKKVEQWQWKILLVVSIIFVVLGLGILFIPFASVSKMLLTCGCILTTDGAVDIVMLIMLKVCLKKGRKRLAERDENSQKKTVGFEEKNEEEPTADISADSENIEVEQNQESAETEEETEDFVETQPETEEGAEETVELQKEEESSEYDEEISQENESPAKEIRDMLNSHEEPLEEWKD